MKISCLPVCHKVLKEQLDGNEKQGKHQLEKT